MQSFVDYAQTTGVYQQGLIESAHYSNHSNDTSLAEGSGNRAPIVVLPGLVSKSVLGIAFLVNTVVIVFFISLTGCVVNVLNIVVFVKQGLKDPITVTLLVLSVADLGSVFPLWVQSMFMTLHFFPETFKDIDPRYLMPFMSWPHSMFVRASCLLTVFIALERWICVTFPLKANRIITTTVAKVYNLIIMLSLFITFVILYSFSRMRKLFLPWENRTLLIITLTQTGQEYAIMTSTLVTTAYLSTFSLLILFTVLTIIKLNRQAEWRKSVSNSTDEKADAATLKSQKVVKMVVVICLLYILTSIPSVGNTLAFIFVYGYGEMKRYYNLYSLVSQTCFTLEVINSTSNFFIYLIMSSNFAATLHELLGVPRRRAGGQSVKASSK